MIKKSIKQLDEHFEEYFMAVLLIMMTVVMLIQVVMRYVFNSALTWPEEFCRYCFIYMTFLTIGFSVSRKSMLRLDLIIKILPRKLGEMLEFIIWVMCLLFFVYMFGYSIKLINLTITSARTSPAMGIPFYIIYISTSIGFGLGIIRNIQFLYIFIRKMVGGYIDKEGDI
ncbi:MAG TPA: TRAP transporter small permease [Sedimentibacter sp.]|jgi:TRAP-type C4-dicarboxylate transport system permease small subunit|nr:TRAP transporter small permease [Sedimentibacter sp.]HQC70353.1 TRAP transporter small permease [Sedimentibacter sp.]HQO72740.1 TRAP transporter small permease [Sedimentibacter sp.]